MSQDRLLDCMMSCCAGLAAQSSGGFDADHSRDSVVRSMTRAGGRMECCRYAHPAQLDRVNVSLMRFRNDSFPHNLTFRTAVEVQIRNAETGKQHNLELWKRALPIRGSQSRTTHLTHNDTMTDRSNVFLIVFHLSSRDSVRSCRLMINNKQCSHFGQELSRYSSSSSTSNLYVC